MVTQKELDRYAGCYYLDYDIVEKHDNLELLNLYDNVHCVERVAIDGTKNKCQFCGRGKGRINDVFSCINKGEQDCFQPRVLEGIKISQQIDEAVGRIVPEKYKVEIDNE